MSLWKARLGSEPAEGLLSFTSSLEVDKRLAGDDITGTRAHVRGLERAGLLPAEEAAVLQAALDHVAEELEGGSFAFAVDDEDIHTAIERRVTEIAGAAGAKIHTGRSRNDQVATDLRLFVKRELAAIARRVLAFQQVLLARAEAADDVYLPGYTHLQRAQPVLLAHHLLAHAWALARDVDRIADALARADVSPLGAGALAGSSLPLDPEAVAADLGFAAAFDNSLDAVADRDFVAEALFGLTLLGVHLSRLGEEIVLWSTEEFGFLHLDDAWATGSSMLPQKKNPDVAELTRGKAGRLIGHLTGILTTLKGLPLSYNRDLQEDKEPLFDAVDQVGRALVAITGVVQTATFDTERMKEAADSPGAATVDLAEWLVEQGMPFREAHGLVASLVRDSLERGVPLTELVGAHPSLGADAVGLLAPGAAVQRRRTRGGAGPGPVARQIERFRDRLTIDEARFKD